MSVEQAQQAWERGHQQDTTYGIFPHPKVTDLYIVIWSWELPVLDDPYNVTSVHIEGDGVVQTGSTEFSFDLRGALAEVLNRIGEITI